MKKSIEQTTGVSYQWFFDQWLYKMGHPIFEVSKNYDLAQKQLVLTVKQTQKIDTADAYPQVDFFKGLVEIEMDGRIEQVRLEAKAENRFTFKLAQTPKFVNFDFESKWISQVYFEKSFDEYLFQLQNSKDVVAKMAAMDSLVAIAKKVETTATDKAKICEAFRNTISSPAYFRLKTYALSRLRTILPPPYDKPTVDLLLNLVKNSESWLKASAIFSLGMTNDLQFADIYIGAFNDKSDRVTNTAATALGKTKSPKAFDALMKLPQKSSWKSQSLISALNGLQELGDLRGADLALKALSDIQSPRWWLATPVWDYPIAAAQTLVALGKNTEGYPIVFEHFKKAVADDDINDIFSQVVLITTLADPRGQAIFEILKAKYKSDAAVLSVVNQHETQFKEAIKK